MKKQLTTYQVEKIFAAKKEKRRKEKIRKAAPELLAALLKARILLCEPGINVDFITGEAISPAMKQIDAAINKAQG